MTGMFNRIDYLGRYWKPKVGRPKPRLRVNVKGWDVCADALFPDMALGVTRGTCHPVSSLATEGTSGNPNG